MSNEIITHSDPICSSAGCNYKSAKSAHPMDYFVPNFGMDQDIMDSQSHESAVSKQLNHTWSWSSKPTAEEIADKNLITGSKAALNQALHAVQKNSDPICSSAFPNCENILPKEKKDERVIYNDYPIDKDITDT